MTKPKMTTSYKFIFGLSILMMFVVLLLAGASGSKSAGIGLWYWGYTAWSMYKRNNEKLVSFHKVFMWFDAVVFSVVAVIMAFNGDAQRYIGFSFFGFVTVGAISTAISYGLMTYFKNQLNSSVSGSSTTVSIATPVDLPASNNNGVSSTNPSNYSDEVRLSEEESSSLYAIAFDEIESGNLDKGLWAKCFSITGGDDNQSKAKYIELRVAALSASALEAKKSKEAEDNLSSLMHRAVMNDAEANLEMGIIKYKGLYNQQPKIVEAFDYLKTAAFLGNAKAQHMLSSMFWKGEGTDKNKSYAHAWAVVASSKVPDAKSNVEYFQREMTMEQIYESDRLVKSISKGLNKDTATETATASGVSNSSSVDDTREEAKSNEFIDWENGKYWFIGFGLLVVAFVGYNLYKEFYPQHEFNISFKNKKAYEFYAHEVWSDCGSPYESKPIMTMEFVYNNQSKEIIAKVDYEEKGVKKQDLTRLEPCTVVNEGNWACGGDVMANGRDVRAKYIMRDGVFSYEESSYSKCNAKIIER